MGNAFSNPQEEEEDQKLTDILQSMELTQQNMSKALAAAKNDQERLQPVIRGFSAMINPTKWILHNVVDKRCAGMPQKRKDACKRISEDFQRVLFETLEFTPTLYKLFRGQMTGAEWLEQVHTTSAQDSKIGYMLEQAHETFTNCEQAAAKSKEKAEHLSALWATLQGAIGAEIQELTKCADDFLWQKRKMYALAGVAAVACFVCGVCLWHFGAAAASAYAAAKSASAASAAYSAKAASAKTAWIFSKDWLLAEHYAYVASTKAALATSASQAAAAAQCSALVSGGVAVVSGGAAVYMGMKASEYQEQAASLAISATRTNMLAEKYRALIRCSSESETLLRIIIEILQTNETDTEDLLKKCEAGLKGVVGLVQSAEAGNQLKRYKSNLHQLVETTDELSLKCKESLAGWAGARNYAGEKITFSGGAYPRSPAPAPNAQDNSDGDSLATEESQSFIDTPTPSEFRFVQELHTSSPP